MKSLEERIGPILGIVANFYIGHFESRALETAPIPQTMWYRHVDAR